MCVCVCPGASACRGSSKGSYLVLSSHHILLFPFNSLLSFPFFSLSLFLSLYISRLIMQHNWSLLILSSPDSAQPAQANFRGWHCWVLAISSSQWAGHYFLSLSGSSPSQVEITVNTACPRSHRLQKLQSIICIITLTFTAWIWHTSYVLFPFKCSLRIQQV